MDTNPCAAPGTIAPASHRRTVPRGLPDNGPMARDLYPLLTPRRMLVASLVVALATIGLKTAAWAVTGSVGLLSDALESLVNLGGAAFALAMVTIAARPPDAGHPYGHHKAEYFSFIDIETHFVNCFGIGKRCTQPRSPGGVPDR